MLHEVGRNEMTATIDNRLILPPVLDTAAAPDLLINLRQRLASGPSLRIDASGVETITLACMQIILATLKCGAGVRVEEPSAAFSRAFADLGLDFGAQEAAVDEITDAPPLLSEEPAMAKRILTIDDSKTIRDMLRLTLLDAGFEVLQAVDGQDGIEVLAKEPVDIVITDINMPKMDGYGVIRHMRDNPAHKSTPVLVLTTESEVEKRNLAREAGATGWMVKPFDPDRLIATINKVAP
jgi:two-component system chemotaxis response regulator CheY